jgi:Uncharacterised conserved protein
VERLERLHQDLLRQIAPDKSGASATQQQQAYRRRSATSLPIDNVADEATSLHENVAKRKENQLVRLIHSIISTVVLVEEDSSSKRTNKGHLRCDPIFEYFCDNMIVAVFIGIFRASPTHEASAGVTWSPVVKAAVLQSFSVLTSRLRDLTGLYYILSQNFMNEVVFAMLPLSQWTESALELMLPPYMDLLKSLTLQLVASPYLFPLFTIVAAPSPNPSEDAVTPSTTFPLLSALLALTCSDYAQSHSFLHVTCLHLVVDLLHVPQSEVRHWLNDTDSNPNALRAQRLLVYHLCHDMLLRRYRQIVNIMKGPVVDSSRHRALEGQIKGNADDLNALNDVFCAGIPTLNVRLCEFLLRDVVGLYVMNLLPSTWGRPSLPNVGVSDVDVIPEMEAQVQAVVFVLSRYVQQLRYAPFLKMLVVTLLHPRSTQLWNDDSRLQSDEYYLVPALHSILADESLEHDMANPYRRELENAIRGDYGEWRMPAAAILLHSIVSHNQIDVQLLQSIRVLPSTDPTTFELALSDFLTRRHGSVSRVAVSALECASSLAMLLLVPRIPVEKEVSQCSVSMNDKSLLNSLTLLSALRQCRNYFYAKALESQAWFGPSDTFVNVFESVSVDRYKCTTTSEGDGPTDFLYRLSRHGCSLHASKLSCLIRQLRGPETSHVESTRYFIAMALHFRAVLRVLVQQDVSASHDLATLEYDLVDRAQDLADIFPALQPRASARAELDLTDRLTFCSHGFHASSSSSLSSSLHRTASLLLVCDPTELLVVRPSSRKQRRGIVLCAISLAHVVAWAVDGPWLHVAVRHENVAGVIQNGNMALCFDNDDDNGRPTIDVVQEHLTTSRLNLRQDAGNRLAALLSATD